MKSKPFLSQQLLSIAAPTANLHVATESARGRSKDARLKLIAALMSLSAAHAHGGPAGGQVVTGTGRIEKSGPTTTITQESANLSLTWQSFNIARQEAVNFVQPSAKSIAVNRIYDTNGSKILGQLNANGQVYLINPNGILFGQGAQVNVGGLVASTLDIRDASLGGATRDFSGNGTGSIVNQGSIIAATGGYVALLGNTVINQGNINAPLGSVALGGGSSIKLTFQENHLVGMHIDQSLLDSLVANGSLIRADGGQVVMNAGAKDTLLASVVNNTGSIEARSIEQHGGSITLLGGMAAGTVNVGGTLDASALAGGNGGVIETSAAHVKVSDSARVTTAASNGRYGTWLIDPQDYTVAASGGDITGAALSSNLGSTGITLQSAMGGSAGAGNVNINDAVTWGANTTLTMTASNNVNINAKITATGDSAGVVINPNTTNGIDAASGVGVFNLGKGASVTLSGAAPSLAIGGTSYTVINSLGVANSQTGTDLQGMQGGLNGHYALGSNLDASASAVWNGNAGFSPVGNSTTPFTGVLDGLGHSISSLTINQPAIANVGLIGFADNQAAIRNVALVGGSVVGGAGTGGLLGKAGSLSISNSSNTGTVSGGAGTGGLAGVITDGSIGNSFTTGAVSGAADTGGLAGRLTTGSVTNSYTTGNVTGAAGTGGLVGVITTGSVVKSYVTGVVNGAAGTGGLVGGLTTGDILNSYSTGAITGAAGTGGLAGTLTTSNVDGSYATGNVTGDAGTGGLAGGLTSGSVSNSFSTGNVKGAAGTGGLAGSISNGGITNSFATGTVTGDANTSGLAGSAPAGSIQHSFAASSGDAVDISAWDPTLWMLSASGTPILRTMVKNVTVTANNFSKIYDGLTGFSGYSVTYSELPAGFTLGAISYGGSATSAKNAGLYNITATMANVSSNNAQYVVSYVNGSLAIAKADAVVTANSASTTYTGATQNASGFTASGLVGGESAAVLTGVSAGGSGKNAGSYATTASGTDANYNLAMNAGTLAIAKAALSLSASSGTKVYDGNTSSAGVVDVAGLVGADSVSSTSQAYASKNVLGVNASTLKVQGGYSVNDGNSGANYAVSTHDVRGSITAQTLDMVVPASVVGKVLPVIRAMPSVTLENRPLVLGLGALAINASVLFSVEELDRDIVGRLVVNLP